MKNIMLCIKQLESGGSETALITHAFALKRKGHRVVVLAESGIYTEVLRNKGIIVEEIDFTLSNGIDFDKVRHVVDIIRKYNIDQVHIHKYFCIQSVWPACIMENIPYIHYLHTVSNEEYEWFEYVCPFYKYMLNTYFLNAEKIVTVTPKGLERHINRFPDIPREKYAILPNCIDFEEYKTKTKVTEIKKFMLISRIADEKIASIESGIDFFTSYVELKKDYSLELDIVGGGPKFDTIAKYINNKKNSKYKIRMLGETNNVSQVMDKYDVVIGIGRCIVEAIALKKVAILTGIEKIKGLVTSKNIQKAMECNFAGRLLHDDKPQRVAKKIEKLKLKDIESLTEYNYNYIYENLNVDDKVICLEESDKKYSTDEIFEQLLKVQNRLLKDLEHK